MRSERPTVLRLGRHGRLTGLLGSGDDRPAPPSPSPPPAARVFSGVQPSGLPHVGNHLGAFSNYIAMQDGYEAIYCIVDYHALTSTHDAELIRRNTREMALGLLALGLDPERAVLFRQSDRPEHVELMWLLASVTPTGWVERTPSFKEKKRNQPDDVNLALLNYPVLQAADIAIYKASYVPVGKDQAAHLELAREIVRAFNARYGRDLPGAGGGLLRGAHRQGHRRRQQDVQVARQRHRDLRRRGHHPAAGHEHGHGHAAAAAQRPGPPGGLQRLPAAPHLQPRRLRGHLGGRAQRHAPVAWTPRSCSPSASWPPSPRPASATGSCSARPGLVEDVLRAGAERLAPLAAATLAECHERMGLAPRS